MKHFPKMRKNLSFIFIYITFFASCQNGYVTSVYQLLSGGYVDNRITDPIAKEAGNFKYEDIAGSPYLNEEFRKASIAADYANIYARYDSYKDVIEYKIDNVVRILPKELQFNRIEFKNSDKIIILASFDGKTTGYYFLLVEGEVSVFKEVSTKFVPEKSTNSSYGSTKTAEFVRDKSNYYIQIGSVIIKNLKNIEKIIEIFPEKKSEILTFINMNNIKIDDEKDLLRLARFLNK